jgi:hypothetical protein
MFVRYYVELAFPLGALEEAIERAPVSWMPIVAHEAESRGADLLTEIGSGGEQAKVNKAVEVEVGSPRKAASRTILPMTWKASGSARLFPKLEADLELAPLGPSRTQLAISARYRPPMGAVARAVDRGALHVVAEATIKDFLDRVADRLTTSLAAASTA